MRSGCRRVRPPWRHAPLRDSRAGMERIGSGVCRISGARSAGGAEATRLALRQTAITSHVAVLAPDDQVHGVVGSDVRDLPHCRRIAPGGAAGLQQMGGVVPELDLDLALVAEVELLLLVVDVTTGL